MLNGFPPTYFFTENSHSKESGKPEAKFVDFTVLPVIFV